MHIIPPPNLPCIHHSVSINSQFQLYSKAHQLGTSRHHILYYPKRCELNQCDCIHNLRACTGCYMVHYCSKEHQSEDWRYHKEDCILFSNLKLRAMFYMDKDILELYPLQETSKNTNALGNFCLICGISDQRERLTLTDCCKLTICDTKDCYELHSKSLEWCPLSHLKFTLCGYHSQECSSRELDWRTCPTCIHNWSDTTSDQLWRGLNSYNFYPMLSRDVPRHSLSQGCGQCRKKFIPAFQGSCLYDDTLVCLDCLKN